MRVSETWALEKFGDGMDFQIPADQRQKHAKILFNYLNNREEDVCTDRNFAVYLLSDI